MSWFFYLCLVLWFTKFIYYPHKKRPERTIQQSQSGCSQEGICYSGMEEVIQKQSFLCNSEGLVDVLQPSFLKDWLMAFANCYGVIILIVTNFKLLLWHQWRQSWKEMLALVLGSQEPLNSAVAHCWQYMWLHSRCTLQRGPPSYNRQL